MLEIRENGAVLTNQTWIAVRNTGAWPGVLPFIIHYMVQMGDVDNDGHALLDDVEVIVGGLGLPAEAGERRDVDGDQHVLFADISSVIPYSGNGPVEKPDGHGR